MNLFIRPQKYETYYVNKISIAIPSILTGLLLTWILLRIMFYFIVTELLNAAKERERVRLLEMQESYFIAQQRYMEASARARHDFRQTIRTLQELAQAKNFYLSGWRNFCPLCHCVTSPPRCGGDKNLSGFREMPPPPCGGGGPIGPEGATSAAHPLR